MTVTVKFIQSNEMVEVQLDEPLQVNTNVVLGRIHGTGLWADFDLLRPQAGWLVYPN